MDRKSIKTGSITGLYLGECIITNTITILFPLILCYTSGYLLEIVIPKERHIVSSYSRLRKTKLMRQDVKSEKIINNIKTRGSTD